MKSLDSRPVKVLLENGWEFSAQGWGDFSKTKNQAFGGEFVFCTAMSGIEESLTDPSFAGQVLVNTVAHVGNTGYTEQDLEAEKIWAEGLICRNLELQPSNWRQKRSLMDWIVGEGRFVVDGLDTREMTMILRDEGSQRGIVLPADSSWNKEKALARLKAEIPPMAGRDLTREVTVARKYDIVSQLGDPAAFGYWPWLEQTFLKDVPALERPLQIAVWDFGVKRNTLRLLSALGANVTVLPATAKADEILAAGRDGILLSNGPGDPGAATYIHEELRKVIGKRTLFAICLGHQLVPHALGGKTYKMKFGHRGIHHPVNELNERGEVCRTWITSQNHGFAVDMDSLPKGVRVSFTHADDGSVEGLSLPDYNCETVQFHPEAAPGPFDSGFLIKNFTSRLSGEGATLIRNGIRNSTGDSAQKFTAKDSL